jgi:hypothetical protein
VSRPTNHADSYAYCDSYRDGDVNANGHGDIYAYSYPDSDGDV